MDQIVLLFLVDSSGTSPPRSVEQMIHLTAATEDANFASGRCGLPTQSLSPNNFSDMGFYSVSDIWFSYMNSTQPENSYRGVRPLDFPGTCASFMNCTKPIKDKYRRYQPVSCLSNNYQPVPCLSNNSTFVYVIIAEDGYMLNCLHPSCEFLSMIPAAAEADARVPGSEIGAFGILQKRFYCVFPLGISRHWVIRECLNESKR